MVAAYEKAQAQRQALTCDPLISLSEAIPMLGNPSYSALRVWIKTGALRVWRAGKHGHFKVRLSEIARFREAGEVHNAPR
jgi:hypothetical protein